MNALFIQNGAVAELSLPVAGGTDNHRLPLGPALGNELLNALRVKLHIIIHHQEVLRLLPGGENILHSHDHSAGIKKVPVSVKHLNPGAEILRFQHFGRTVGAAVIHNHEGKGQIRISLYQSPHRLTGLFFSIKAGKQCQYRIQNDLPFQFPRFFRELCVLYSRNISLVASSTDWRG